MIPPCKARLPCRAVSVFGLALLAVLQVGGQEEDEAWISLGFRVGAPENIAGVHFPIYGEGATADAARVEDSEEIGFVRSGRSALYEYRGPNPVVFYRLVEGVDEEGNETTRRQSVARVKIPEGIEMALLFFIPRSDSEDKYRVIPIDGSASRREAGDLTVLNASPFNVATAHQGIDPRVIRPGQRLDFEASEVPGASLDSPRPRTTEPAGASQAEAPDDLNNYGGDMSRATVQLKFAVETGEGDWRMLNYRMLTVSANETRVLVFYPPKVEGSYYLRPALFKVPITAP